MTFGHFLMAFADFSDMLGFVSIDNRPEFFLDLMNSSYLNDTFIYNVTNSSSTSFGTKDEKRDTLDFILMSIVTVVLGLLILITIIGEWTKTKLRSSQMFIDFVLSTFFRKCFRYHCRADWEALAELRQLFGGIFSRRWLARRVLG